VVDDAEAGGGKYMYAHASVQRCPLETARVRERGLSLSSVSESHVWLCMAQLEVAANSVMPAIWLFVVPGKYRAG
jgi:hypothetical protein